MISAGTPRSFEELLSNKWQGQIAFANPVKSGSSYTALFTLIQAFDDVYSKEEIIARFIYNLNGSVIEESPNVVEAVAKGEKMVGITSEENALKNIMNGADIGMSYPKEGTSMIPDGCAIIKNAPHIENAKLFIEFIVSEDVQRLLEEQLYRRSVRNDVTNKEAIPTADYDIQYAEENRDEVLDLWSTYLTSYDKNE